MLAKSTVQHLHFDIGQYAVDPPARLTLSRSSIRDASPLITPTTGWEVPNLIVVQDKADGNLPQIVLALRQASGLTPCLNSRK
jgi:hypothetical protein